jgi:hypothetical protein
MNIHSTNHSEIPSLCSHVGTPVTAWQTPKAEFGFWLLPVISKLSRRWVACVLSRYQFQFAQPHAHFGSTEVRVA